LFWTPACLWSFPRVGVSPPERASWSLSVCCRSDLSSQSFPCRSPPQNKNPLRILALFATHPPDTQKDCSLPSPFLLAKESLLVQTFYRRGVSFGTTRFSVPLYRLKAFRPLFTMEAVFTLFLYFLAAPLVLPFGHLCYASLVQISTAFSSLFPLGGLGVIIPLGPLSDSFSLSPAQVSCFIFPLELVFSPCFVWFPLPHSPFSARSQLISGADDGVDPIVLLYAFPSRKIPRPLLSSSTFLSLSPISPFHCT